MQHLKNFILALIGIVLFSLILSLASCQAEPEPALEEWIPHGKQCTPQTCEFGEYSMTTTTKKGRSSVRLTAVVVKQSFNNRFVYIGSLRRSDGTRLSGSSTKRYNTYEEAATAINKKAEARMKLTDASIKLIEERTIASNKAQQRAWDNQCYQIPVCEYKTQQQIWEEKNVRV